MHRRLVEPAGVFALFAALYSLFRTPAYNYDGYTYFLQGYAALESLNPHHLAWIPAQAILDRAAALAGVHPLTLASFLGAFLSALTLALFDALFLRLRTR